MLLYCSWIYSTSAFYRLYPCTRGPQTPSPAGESHSSCAWRSRMHDIKMQALNLYPLQAFYLLNHSATSLKSVEEKVKGLKWKQNASETPASAGAECVAAREGVKLLLMVRNLCEFLLDTNFPPIPVFMDNKAGKD